MEFMPFLFFLLLCFAGGTIGQWLKIPVGAILGAMFAVGIAKTFHLLSMASTPLLTFCMQVTLGLMVGLTFSKISIEQLKRLAKSLIVITVSVFVVTFGAGLAVSLFPNLSTNLSLLSAAPGGMIEMATIAKTLSLEAPVVIMFHLARVIAVMTIFPLLLQYFYSRQVEKKGSAGYETMDHH